VHGFIPSSLGIAILAEFNVMVVDDLFNQAWLNRSVCFFFERLF
jgi:hypothetical protein